MFRNSAIRNAVLFAGLGCLLASSILEAGEVKWNKDLRQAATEAAKQEKPLMVMVSAPWCGYCQQMLKTTFRDEALIEHVNSCFVPVYLDADQNEDLVEQLQVEGLPTTLIISPEMKVVKRLEGFQSAGQMNGHIVKLCNHAEAPVPVKPAVITKPVAASAVYDGTCLVSLRDDGKLVKGQSAWTSTHKGQTVWFASAEHKKRFDARPEMYWPVADGICLVSNRVDQAPRPGQPVLAMIYADRVWFFADKAHQEKFVSDPKPYLGLVRN
jgi:YHS domain-containing protein/thioredoxin-related protein